ncbi:MAG: CAP domain-containing protein [Reichenbachiella sp.]|uniref:CAP domain-containing protein n=3 Tax=Reichenbachiella sp. TaxID=2184521 RepID=UPI0032973B5A
MKKSAALFIITIFSSQLLLAQKANDQEMKLLIEKHNYWRSEVGIGDISYSDELATAANSWAIELKKQGCNFSTSQNAYGENIFKGTVGYFTVGDAVDSWGAEKQNYDYKKNKCETGKICGHYTQIVWKNTTEIGCAKTLCDGSVIWICNYNPPGNFVGQKPY